MRNLQVKDLLFQNGELSPVNANTSIAVDEGEVLVLFGPNAAGKSSLLEAVLGEKNTVSGSVSNSYHYTSNTLWLVEYVFES